MLLAFVRDRAVAANDRTAARLTLAVLALNELSNVAFFGRRSTRNGFPGQLGFAAPVVALQPAVKRDRISTLALAPYTAGSSYDIPWTYVL